MTWNAVAHAAWEHKELEQHLGGDEYDYDLFEDLPYVFCKKTRRWRDRETGEFVGWKRAVDANDEECERQAEAAREAEYD